MFIELPIVLPNVLPIVLPIELPIEPLRRPRVLGRAGLAWGAKGPGPDRLGLGGQGSWAGPAWLGGPRVLGRAGLAWGAKGPGPDRLGLLHFQKVPY